MKTPGWPKPVDRPSPLVSIRASQNCNGPASSVPPVGGLAEEPQEIAMAVEPAGTGGLVDWASGLPTPFERKGRLIDASSRLLEEGRVSLSYGPIRSFGWTKAARLKWRYLSIVSQLSYRGSLVDTVVAT